MAETTEEKNVGLHPTPESQHNSDRAPSSDSSIAEHADVNAKTLLRKLDYRLLPPLTILYLLSFLDRSNVGNARLKGMGTDLDMSGDQYLTGLTLYFIGYVFEMSCNIVLKKTTPRTWLPTLTLIWGVVAKLCGVVQNYAGFLVSRLPLGIAESGLFPGVMFYLSMWYKRNEQHYQEIAHMRGVGGYNDWRWIFISEGLLTIVMSIAAYCWVFNYPSTAEFLTNKERTYIKNRLKNDSDATRNEQFSWDAVGNAFQDPKVWLYGLAFHTLSLPLYILTLFMPTIITTLGYTSAPAQLLTVPPYAFAFLITLTTAIPSERTHRRAPFILAAATLAFLAAAGFYPVVATMLAWPANNVSGQSKRAIANALQISIGNLGAVLGTQLYRTETKPRYFLGHGFALGYLVGKSVVVTVLWRVLKRENRVKEGLRGDLSRQYEEFFGDGDPRWVFQT
ncbi:MFS general substrate transporter [Aspergillus homomorphus CBS 101889]|uniref:MFS general substrate transporter n=1 Tax=Aspergillus homomorphus (strain CBS 101889) TaxID=1450537 RepID=A0A395IA56_ASPHC|nr:MFS general substrate transporter [Aspergillus homomorphus CBS 101889]RAL17047.1 MFS general substrate transporter [Aspergillus homomorphus CBS 101889]